VNKLVFLFMSSNNLKQKPDFSPKWFWDFDYNKIDWQVSYKTVIGRIIERGNEKEWTGLIRFYGKDTVLNALKNEIVYLPEYAIDEASKYFLIPKEDMLCYTRRQSRPAHWI
jgi:hypothetical protein